VPPLIFWSVMLPVLYFVYLNYIATTDNPTIDMSTFTWQMTVTKICTFIFNFNYDTTPLWYLYMLIGLYFVIPVFGAWLDRASQKDVKLFLRIWGISLFLPYLKMAAPALGYIGNWGNMDILGVCDWNAFGSFYYVSGFIGYLILAYYLVKYPLQWSWKKTLSIGIPMFAAGYAITFGGYLIMQEYFPGNRMAIRRHQCIYDDLPCVCHYAENQSALLSCPFPTGLNDLRYLPLPFCLCANRV